MRILERQYLININNLYNNMLFKAKKKRPIDVFSTIKKPHLEEAYVKFPGGKLRRVSRKRGKCWGDLNGQLIEKLQGKYMADYTAIHTHPSNLPVPSTVDLINFLRFKKRKTEIIVPLNMDNHQCPSGYFVMKKNKDFNYNLSEEEVYDLAVEMTAYGQADNIEDAAKSLKVLSSKYKFSYRFFPVKGEPISKEARKLRSSRQSIETILSIISFVLLSLSIFYNGAGITGNIILKNTAKFNSKISLAIFIMGLCSVSFVFLLRLPLHHRYKYSHER